MYNSITEDKIKQIPKIGDIDIDRLPQELTKIYAQIISFKRQFADGTINFHEDEFQECLQTLQTLANNLETIIVVNPSHELKESIAFVAGTAHSHIHKMSMLMNYQSGEELEIDTISPLISAIVLFLIGNSQADAAEAAKQLMISDNSSLTVRRLTAYIKSLAEGRLSEIINNPFNENDIETIDIQEKALDYLWRELGLGIYRIAVSLSGKSIKIGSKSFDSVIDLSVSDPIIFEQKSIFSGPYHLSKLFKILERNILNRGIVNIPAPRGIIHRRWEHFLTEIAKERPYLWENHMDVVKTNFLNSGVSAILTLPTGAGKTTLSDLKIASCLLSGKDVIYLVPTHALEDQTNKNLKSLFHEYSPENIEVDGEYTELGVSQSFPITVMTPERCLSLQNMNPEFFDNIGLVVFDEFHLIHGTHISRERRAMDAMYCLISLFFNNPEADYLLISAMVENGEEISEWVAKVTGRECISFNSSWKPTRQLHGCLIFEERDVVALQQRIYQTKIKRITKNPPVKLRREMNIIPYCLFSLKNIWETEDDSDYHKTNILEESILLGINDLWKLTSNRNDIASKLGLHFAKMGFKTLIFVADPRIAYSTSQKIALALDQRTNSYSDFIRTNSSYVESLRLELGDIKYSYFHSHKNVGIHHGLLFPIERDLIEQYFKQHNGSIALVATATLAQGINLPAEIVIIAGDDRFNEDTNSREPVPPHELLNAAGRAGRAGQSSHGAVIVIPGEIVTINGSTISKRWWTLKNEVFSKSDQCLIVEDTLESFLDSIQDETEPLDINQTNVLYRFKSENLSETETKNLLRNSFYAFKATKANKQETFNELVESLLRRRNELDTLSEDIDWTKEISFKTGIDPVLILELGRAIENEDLEDLTNLSIIQLIDWFFIWLTESKSHITKIFTKHSTISQINKAVGLRPENEDVDEIVSHLLTLKNLLIQYIQGDSLDIINESIPGMQDLYLTKARNFVIRLVPDISFGFGFLSMVIIEKAKQNGRQKEDLPLSIRALASCIREGFDEVGKLLYKHENKLLMRVETHLKFKEEN